jgi:aerobic C4-dicarboxylate transport protein
VAGTTAASHHRPWYKQIYLWVLVGIVAGILVGQFSPDTGIALEPVGLAFVSLIKMVITPVIFCTVVAGIASMESVKKVGRIGGKALLYFEAMTTVALVLGLVVMNVTKPGAGVNADVGKIKVTDTVSGLIEQGKISHWYDFIFHIFPSSVVGAFAEGNILQVLFFSVVFAFAVMHLGERGRPIVAGIERTGQAFFGVIRIVMYAAPIGAFGAMAFTIGKYGLDTLTSLLQLILTFYFTATFFVVVILGLVARYAGVNIFKLLRYLKEELLIVLGTSSSESVLPQVMRKLEHLGVPKPVVGLTVPTGYSFNLDGTCLYLTLAALYLAQATNIPLSLGQQLGIIGVLLLTSKGAAGVTGSGFIVLAATLSSVGTIPVAAIMLIFGIDKFMSECRALTNMIGNSVATLVVAKSENVFDVERARRILNREEVLDEMSIFDEDDAAIVTTPPALVPAGI